MGDERELKLPLRWQEDYAYAFIFDADDEVVAFLGDTKASRQPLDWHKVAAEIVEAVNASAAAERRGAEREREECAAVCRKVYAEHKKSRSYPADMGGLASECEARILAREAE